MPDPQDLDLWLDVDGRTYQRSTTRHMLFPVTRLVSYISGFMGLHPGDIISTGTPPGIGMGQQPPTYLRPGNRVRLGVQSLGEQTQRVVDHDARYVIDFTASRTDHSANMYSSKATDYLWEFLLHIRQETSIFETTLS